MTPRVISYRSTSAKGVLQSVDFSSVAGDNYAFFQFYDSAGLASIRAAMETPPLSQEIVAVTYVSGRPLLITRNHTSPFTILDALKERGETFEPMHEKKTFDAWKLRSYLGFGGQGLQLISSFLRPPLTDKAHPTFRDRIDTSVLVFAVANLAANAINLAYEGEKIDDKHQLRYLKQRVNRELSSHLEPGVAPLSIDDRRAALREEEAKHTPVEEAKGFLKRHSVQIGELGLRYLGALGLAFPVRYWKAAWEAKSFPPRLDSSKWRIYTGLSSVLGKSIAFSSRIADPYNPKPPGWLDALREKWTFLAGGLIEVTSFSALAYDCFFHSTGSPVNEKRGIFIRNKHYPDWLGGIGASMFVLGYIVRSWAKFGEREVNMKELYAHASDTLANAAPEKIPQLVANTAASLTEHFNQENPVGYATIYTNLINDLTKYHAVAMKPVPHSSLSKTPAAVPPAVERPGHRVSAVQTQRSAPYGSSNAFAR